MVIFCKYSKLIHIYKVSTSNQQLIVTSLLSKTEHIQSSCTYYLNKIQ